VYVVTTSGTFDLDTRQHVCVHLFDKCALLIHDENIEQAVIKLIDWTVSCFSGLSTCLPSKTARIDGPHEKNDYPFYYSIQQDTTSTRSCNSHNQSLSMETSEANSDRDKILFSNPCSPYKMSDGNHFNLLYQNIIRSLPAHTDLRYFAVSILTTKGCRIEIPNTGLSLTVPEDAVLLDEEHLIYIALLTLENQMPPLSDNQTRLSPVILIGPSEITLLKPAVLAFEHSARLDESWIFQLMFTDDLLHWKSLVTHGQETIATPVYLQFQHERQTFVLVSEMRSFQQPIDPTHPHPV
jgi:hypothetical protein